MSEDEINMLGPETAVTFDRPALPDPHETRFRIWFHRLLIFCALALYAAYMYRAYVGWKTEPLTLTEPNVVSRTCAWLDVIGVGPEGKPITWYQCQTKFSDGTVYKTLGDAKP